MAKRTRTRATAAKRPKAAKRTAARKRSAKAQQAPAAAGSPRLARVAKGRKPRYFADPATDKLLWMSLTLMEELSVTRDRLDVVERLLARKRLVSQTEIDGWVGDAKAAARIIRSTNAARRVDRASAEAELAEATGRGMPMSEREVVAAVEE